MMMIWVDSNSRDRISPSEVLKLSAAWWNVLSWLNFKQPDGDDFVDLDLDFDLKF